ncbi:MAG: metalloregulator ArsR/SmtB family transcription factor [Verrucomicrobiales bacterium]
MKPESDEALEMVAGWFRALSEPSRLKILRALDGGPQRITDLVEATGLGQTNVSRHVQALVAAGIKSSDAARGNTAVCRIIDRRSPNLCRTVCQGLVDRRRGSRRWNKGLSRVQQNRSMDFQSMSGVAAVREGRLPARRQGTKLRC